MKKLTKVENDVNQIHNELEDIVIEDEVVVQMPSKLLDYNLKKFKSFKDIKKTYKKNNQKEVFLSSIREGLLRTYDASNHEKKKELLHIVLEIAESFFIFGNKKEREEIKGETVRMLMQPYFKDEDMLELMINLTLPKVVKSTFRKRSWRKIKLFFSKILHKV
jgi:hypothetical protein